MDGLHNLQPCSGRAGMISMAARRRPPAIMPATTMAAAAMLMLYLSGVDAIHIADNNDGTFTNPGTYIPWLSWQGLQAVQRPAGHEAHWHSSSHPTSSTISTCIGPMLSLHKTC